MYENDIESANLLNLDISSLTGGHRQGVTQKLRTNVQPLSTSARGQKHFTDACTE